MFTKEIVQKMKEDELSQKVVIPLLKAMGFQDVFYHHGGINEQGKDIVCWKRDELNARKNYALVIKVVPITGQAKSGKGTAGEVATQIQQTFGSDFLDPVTSEPQTVHECWVVTSQKIIPGGETSIRSIIKSSNFDRHVKFVDGDKLWDLVEKYLAAQTPLGKLLEVQKMLDGIDPYYQPVIHFDGNEMKVSLREKFKGAMKENPLNINVAFDFPNTPDGQLAKDALKSHYTAGGPVAISSNFIQSIDLPETIKKLFGPDFKIEKVEISPIPSDHHFVAKIEIVCDDGDSFVLSHVDLKVKQSGTEESTLENVEIGSLFKVLLVLNFHSKTAQITFKWNLVKDSYSCTQLLQMYEFQNCLSKPFVIHVISEELGVSVFSQQSSQGISEPPQKFFFNSLKVLVKLQQKINKPIMIPTRELTDDEIKAIAELIQIVQTGKISGKWTEFDIELTNLSQEGFAVLSSGPSFLRFSGEQFENIFGVPIPLGKADTVYRNAMLANLKDVQDKHNAGSSDLKLHFYAQDGKAEAEVVYEEYFREPS